MPAQETGVPDAVECADDRRKIDVPSAGCQMQMRFVEVYARTNGFISPTWILPHMFTAKLIRHVDHPIHPGYLG